MSVQAAGYDIKKYRHKAFELLQKLNIDKYYKQIPKNLSGGERQRVAIARALITNPKLIIADEPTGNLDEENSKNVISILLEICKQNGSSLLLVTHNKEFIKHMDISLMLENKKLTQTK